jgi:hypothetical protein
VLGSLYRVEKCREIQGAHAQYGAGQSIVSKPANNGCEAARVFQRYLTSLFLTFASDNEVGNGVKALLIGWDVDVNSYVYFSSWKQLVVRTPLP